MAAARADVFYTFPEPEGPASRKTRSKPKTRKQAQTKEAQSNAAIIREELLLLFKNLKIRRGRRISRKFIEECMEEVLAEHGVNFDPAYMLTSILNNGSPFAVNCEAIWIETKPRAIGFDGEGWRRIGKGRYRRMA